MDAKKKWYRDYKYLVSTNLALISIIIGLLVFWHPTREVRVTVADTKREPIAGALIRTDMQGTETRTDSQGHATFTVPSDLKRLRITASKEGFEPREVEIDLVPDLVPVRLVLSPKGETVEFISLIVIAIDDTTEGRIPGVRILSDAQSVNRETDDQGRLTINVRPDLKKLLLTFTKPGYRIKNAEIDVFTGMDPQIIRLEHAR